MANEYSDKKRILSYACSTQTGRKITDKTKAQELGYQERMQMKKNKTDNHLAKMNMNRQMAKR